APFKAFKSYAIARAWVPLDDEHTMFIMMGAKDGPNETNDFDHHLPNTTDFLGRWRCDQTFANDYMMDRDLQRKSSYTGIEGIHQQDQAITESMGDITDHSLERLAPSDQMITATRKRLLNAAKAYQKDGSLPAAAGDPALYREQRGGFFLASDDRKWPEVYDQEMAAVTNPQREAAE
ncbi:MAG: (2Fe-2S)-binding protein, partial [Rhodospirillaceae bacterium]|nr:(2Fe-2S)-binding protein [Rhodospirillaceae bacterium]